MSAQRGAQFREGQAGQHVLRREPGAARRERGPVQVLETADAVRITRQDHLHAAIARQVAEIGAAISGSQSLREKVEGSMWKMTDRSATGCRLTGAWREALRLGDILAIKEDDAWMIGAIRRMQRDDDDRLTLGAEIVARRFLRVLLRPWSGGEPQPAAEQPSFAIYIPADGENRRASQSSLIGAPDRLVSGAMVDLHTARGHYLVRITGAVEQQHGWVWALFNTVRKLER